MVWPVLARRICRPCRTTPAEAGIVSERKLLLRTETEHPDKRQQRSECQPLHRQRIRFRRQRRLIFQQSYQKHLPVREQCGNEKQLRFFRLIRYRKLHQRYRKQRQFYNQINIFDKESKS